MTAVESTRAAFLADILAHPDDDTPRMVFADWLEEHGEEARGEFVRVQCELATICADIKAGKKLKPWGGGKRFRRRVLLQRREQFLLSDVQDRVKAEWMAWTPGDDCWWEAWEFRRGFVHSVTLPAADWLANADALLRAHPIRLVELTSWPQAERRTTNERRDGGLAVEARIIGRRAWHDLPGVWSPWRMTEAGQVGPELTDSLLSAEWPALAFHLPA